MRGSRERLRNIWSRNFKRPFFTGRLVTDNAAATKSQYKDPTMGGQRRWACTCGCDKKMVCRALLLDGWTIEDAAITKSQCKDVPNNGGRKEVSMYLCGWQEIALWIPFGQKQYVCSVMVGTAWRLVVGSWPCQYDAGAGLWLVVVDVW